MSQKERTAEQIIKNFDLYDRLKRFTDIRTNPSIPLPTILVCVLLMPVLYRPSLLAVDRLARGKWLRRLCGSSRAMVASDSTMNRTLRWLSHGELERFVSSTIGTLSERRLLNTRLVPGEGTRRIAAVDGTHMGGHWMAAGALIGQITAVARLRRYRGRGLERRAGRQVIEELAGDTAAALVSLVG